MRERTGGRSGRSARLTGLGAMLVGCLILAGCAQPLPAGSSARTSGSPSVDTAPAEESAGTPAPSLVACRSADLSTRTPGTVTIATSAAGTTPWFGGSGPPPGAGLEDSVASAIAGTLGYQADQVRWSSLDREAVLDGQAADFDFAIDRFTEPTAAGGADVPVDYSTGYFSITAAVVQRADSAPITSSAQLGSLTVGRVPEASWPGAVRQSVAYPTTDAAVAALTSGTVDALVLTTPTAIAVAQANTGLSVVGQLPVDPSAQPDQFVVVLPHASGLTGCVSTAIDRLRVEGTLDQLAHQWIDPLAPPLS